MLLTCWSSNPGEVQTFLPQYAVQFASMQRLERSRLRINSERTESVPSLERSIPVKCGLQGHGLYVLNGIPQQDPHMLCVLACNTQGPSLPEQFFRPISFYQLLENNKLGFRCSGCPTTWGCILLNKVVVFLLVSMQHLHWCIAEVFHAPCCVIEVRREAGCRSSFEMTCMEVALCAHFFLLQNHTRMKIILRASAPA